MQCRNCRCYLENDYRYCPRCGAPSSRWPMPGAPWLRHPAAIGGLAVLLVAWLIALQSQMRGSALGPSAKERQPAPEPQVVARAPTGLPWYEQQPRSSHSLPVSMRQGDRSDRRATRSHTVHPPTRRAAYRKPIRRSQDSGRVATWRARPVKRERARYLARARRPHQQRRMARWSVFGTPVPARFSANPSRRTAASSGLIVNVTARPYGAKTFVYLNRGSMLGTTPLSVRFDRPGRHQLLFWTPSLGKRVVRTVQVSARGRQWVSATMGASRELARGD
jgi:hypothetical protein